MQCWGSKEAESVKQKWRVYDGNIVVLERSWHHQDQIKEKFERAWNDWFLNSRGWWNGDFRKRRTGSYEEGDLGFS